MSGVVKIEINESAETLKKLLKSASTPQEKEKIQTIYWLKTKTVETVKQIAIMLGRNGSIPLFHQPNFCILSSAKKLWKKRRFRNEYNYSLA